LLAITGGLQHGATRELLWLLVVGVDLAAGFAGFYVPGLGRSTTRDWNIEGRHAAERCRSFVLIALGESIVVIGATLSGLPNIGIRELAAMTVAFTASVGLWWVYFDRSAEAAENVMATSKDPGRLARSAYQTSVGDRVAVEVRAECGIELAETLVALNIGLVPSRVGLDHVAHAHACINRLMNISEGAPGHTGQ
jgi:hypothetical protein